MVEFIFSLVILIICALPLVAVGISQMKSKEPVGFWSGVKPPAPEQVTDIPSYNKKHGRMWFFYGIGLVLCYLISIPLKNEIVSTILVGTEVFGGLIGMMLYHRYLDKKYKIS